MKSLQEAIREKVEKEIERRKEAQRLAQEEADQLAQAEQVAATEALALIQRRVGFRLDGWECRARFDFSDESKDYFKVYLAAESGRDHPYRINFEDKNGRSPSMLIMNKEGEVYFEINHPMMAYHTLPGGSSKSREFDDLLEALIFARFGNAEPEAILESLNGAEV